MAPGRTGRYGRYVSGSRALRAEKKNYDLGNCVTEANAVNPGVNQLQGTFLGFKMAGCPVDVASQGRCPLLGLGQGTGANQRIGRKIQVVSLQLTGVVSFVPRPIVDASWGTAVTPLYGAVGRMWVDIYVVLDKQFNGITAGVPSSDVWSNTTVGFLQRNLDYGHRFRILNHTRVMCPPLQPIDIGAAETTAFRHDVPVDIIIPMNISVEYSGTTGANSEIKENNILIFTGKSWPDSQTPGPPIVPIGQPTLVGTLNSRIRYYDA